MKKQLSLGFTLIELLVVIGILGILAGTLFFTINPIEQLNRGRDAARKTAIESMTTALSAYNATNSTFPWTGAPATCNPVAGGTALSASAGAGCVNTLVTAGELKPTFDDDTQTMAAIFLSPAVVGNRSFALCFAPTSTAEAAAATYAQNGNAWASGTRYWCILQ